MAVWCLGSVNADHFYQVPHLPAPGETLAATDYSRGLGGKGANMAVAAARAGAQVALIGAVGPDGGWMRDRLADYGVSVSDLAESGLASGHAIISVDPSGENQITIFAGANRALEAEPVARALSQGAPGDVFLCQNETNLQREAAEIAASRGMRIVYAAAPFDVAATSAMLDIADLLVLNAVEAAQLEASTGQDIAALPVGDVIVTLGSDGVRWVSQGRSQDFPAVRVKAVDTTGAGDTFTGYLVAALDGGAAMPDAIDLAQRAAAIKVMRRGTADAIPARAEVDDWRA